MSDKNLPIVPEEAAEMAKKKGDQYDSDGAEDQDYDEEPVFEDPAGFVDDVGDDGGFCWLLWGLWVVVLFAH